MADNNSNELMEVNSADSSKDNGRIDGNTIQLMQDFTNTIIGFSKQIAENNAAKYKAQAEVMIADIQDEMEKECREINGYYKKREQQGESFDKIIAAYQEEFRNLTNRCLEVEDDSKIEFLKWSMEQLKSAMGNQLNHLMNEIQSEQETRKDISKRRQGLRGFFKRR